MEHLRIMNACYFYLVLTTFEFYQQILERKKNWILNFTQISLVGAELFQADRRTDRHDQANRRHSLLCQRS